MSLISVRNLEFSYAQSSVKAVDNVSFDIEKGSYTAIVGTNGSGKSTIARLICDLEKPAGGTIEKDSNLRIGLVFQSPKDQLVSSIVAKDTAFGPQNLKLPKGEVELRTIECLNIVELLDKANSSTTALSLGQTQKVALSGMVALWPEVLILDEAVAMLDPESRQKIFEFLRYWHKTNHTIIHITHDIDAVREADFVIGIEKGKVVYNGDRVKFLEKPENVDFINGKPLEPARQWLKPAVEKGEIEKTLSFQKVSFAYDASDEKSRVTDISFDLYKGTLTAMTGPSGAGKSTILELGSGLLEKSDGKILSNGTPALVQQNCSAALFENFAADDVAFGPMNRGVKGKKLKETVKSAMERAGVPYDQFGERQTARLSGGEQRRLAIAGILAMEDDILFFDEPTAGLDGKARYQIMQLLRQLAGEGKTVLFTTHRLDEAAFADREIKILNGKVTEDSLWNIKSEKNTEDNLSELKMHSAATMLKGLRGASLSVSGAKKKGKSPVEKLPAFIRILLFLVLFVVSLVVRPWWLCLTMFGVSLFYCLLSGFNLKRLLIAMLKIFPFLLFFAILQLLVHPALPDEQVYFAWKFITITPSKLLFVLAAFLRTDASLACISGFFISTPEQDLIQGLKVLLFPLEVIKIPVRYFILIIEIIFRFVPLLLDECISIIKTQIIRGGMKKVKGVMSKIRAIVPLIVPLLIQTIKRSEALADAITMRCFK